MSNKPQIDYDKVESYFTKDGVVITDKQVREIWDYDADADWTLTACEAFSRRALA